MQAINFALTETSAAVPTAGSDCSSECIRSSSKAVSTIHLSADPTKKVYGPQNLRGRWWMDGGSRPKSLTLTACMTRRSFATPLPPVYWKRWRQFRFILTARRSRDESLFLGFVSHVGYVSSPCWGPGGGWGVGGYGAEPWQWRIKSVSLPSVGSKGKIKRRCWIYRTLSAALTCWYFSLPWFSCVMSLAAPPRCLTFHWRVSLIARWSEARLIFKIK